MSSVDVQASSASLLQSLLSLILKPEYLRSAVAVLLDLWRSARFRGTYTVDKHSASLELLDKRGHRAVYSKEQRVTFIQDNIFAIQDQAWGDGKLFADYKCSPGVAVDRYKEGYRYKILISLHTTKNKGDSETYVIERTIEDGFTTTICNFQTQIDHPTNHLELALTFPLRRRPKWVRLVEQNANRSIPLIQENLRELPDGRVRYDWSMRKPHLFEGYILQWEW